MVEQYPHLENHDVESILCKVGVNRNCINVGVFYRPPNSKTEVDEVMFKQFHAISKNKAVILGDFNYPGINWDSLHADNHGSAFVETCLDNFLHQHALELTRVNNTLDLVLSTEKEIIQDVVIQIVITIL